MSEKEKEKNAPSPKKKKGFYIALYSCVGVMLALAAVIGYFNWNAPNPSSPSLNSGSVNNQAQGQGVATEKPSVSANSGSGIGVNPWDDIAAVDSRTDSGYPGGKEENNAAEKSTQSNSESYLTPSDRSEIGSAISGGNYSGDTQQNQSSSSSEDIKIPEAQTVVNDSPVSQDNISENKITDSSAADNQTADSNISDNSITDTNAEGVWKPTVEGGILYAFVPADENNQTTDIEAGVEVEAAETDDSGETAEASPKEFTAYTGDEKMQWPLAGNILMEYSPDRLIYDKTLNQYRTNETLCISADIDAEVKAAAAGRITDVYKTKEDGKTVVIDHGNGWLTTYSQLQDDILVEVGDVVNAGEVFAKVGEPSIYSILLGNHLGFEVVNNDETVNPSITLAAN